MKAVGALLIAALCTALAGCGSKEPKYLSSPEPFEAHGPYAHAASGMIFPTAVGEFQRVLLLRYDAEGTDVSAGYNLITPSGSIVVTVYVYPAPSLVSIGSPPDVVASARANLCASEFSRRKSEILSAHQGANVTSERSVVSPGGNTEYPGKMGSYQYDQRFEGRLQPVRSELFIFCYVGGMWALEYRFTSPAGLNDAGAIDAFMSHLKWTISGTS